MDNSFEENYLYYTKQNSVKIIPNNCTCKDCLYQPICSWTLGQKQEGRVCNYLPNKIGKGNQR